MSTRLRECKHSLRLPSLSFGATTEYHRSSQPLYPLTRSHQHHLHEAGEPMLAAVRCSTARNPRIPTRARTAEADRAR